MNQITQPKLGAQVAITSGENGFAVTPQTLNDIVEFAKFMCQSNAGIPAYLRNNAPDCAAITMQALKWNFDPFSVAQKSYKVKDVLAYEAQLIAAVVNTRSGIKGRLKYAYSGDKDTLTCTVTGILDGEEYAYTSPPVGSITTKNSPLWKTDPQQQLGYYSARSWARRYTPEVLLGVYDRDEAEEFRGPEKAKDITPTFDPFADDLYTPPQTPQSGNRTWTGDILAEAEENASAGSYSDNSVSGVSSSQAQPEQPDDYPQSSENAADGDNSSSSPSAAPIPEVDLPKLRAYAKDVLHRAADKNTSAEMFKKIEARWAEDISKLSDEGKLAARSIANSCRSIMRGDVSLNPALEFHAEGLLCDVNEIGG